MTLKNIILDDGGIHEGTYFAQTNNDTISESNLDFVQDSMITAHGLTEARVDIILDEGAVLKDFGGMSALYGTTNAHITLKAGSKICDEVVTNRSKSENPHEDENGPAGIVWLQGSEFVMETGSEIGGIVGRVVYADGGTARIGGKVYNIKSDGDMWQGAGGLIAHVRNDAKCTLTDGCVITNSFDDPSVAADSLFNIVQGGSTVVMEKGAKIHKWNGRGNVFTVGYGGILEIGGEICDVNTNSNHVVQIGDSRLKIDESAFIHNNRVNYGAIYIQGGNKVFIYGKINNNYSADRGGAVAITNHGDSEVHMYDGAEMIGNYSAQTGGGLLVSDGTFTMHGGVISNNNASLDGGGVFVRQGGNFIMEGGEIKENETACEGGGISIEPGSGTVKLNGGSIGGNRMNSTLAVDSDSGTCVAKGGVTNDISISADNPSSISSYLSVSSAFSLGDSEIFTSKYDFYIENPGHNVKLGNASSACETFVTGKLSGQNLTDVCGSFWYETDAASQSFDISKISYDTDENLYAAIIATNDAGAPVTGGEVSLRAVEIAESGSLTLSVPGQNATGYAVVFVQEADHPAQVVTVTPADITVYEGGDGYSAVVDDDGSTATHNSMPHPIFRFEGVADATGMVFANSDASKSWRVVPDGSGYYHFETQAGQNDVRVTYTDVFGNAVTNDRFDVTTIGETFAQYAIDLYLGDNNLGSITAEQGSQKYAVALGTGTLTVRAVEADNPATVTSSIAENPPTSTLAPGTALAVVPSGGTTYSLNDTGVPLPEDASPALLFDDIITSDGVDRTAALKSRADTILGGGSEGRQYQMKYLDLVDGSNSNAWITSSSGIDIYWAYPQGTDQSTKFTLLHFKNLHRDGTQSGFDVSDVADCEVEEEDVERTSQGIRFHVGEGGFSPFVLTWTESSDPDPGEGGTVVPSKVKLTYVENGGSPVADVTVPRGTSVALATPVREGYTFEGWFFDSGLTEPAGMGGARITLYANTTVYAKWSRSEAPGSFVTDHINYIMGRETEDGERLIAPLSDVTRAEVATMVFRLLKPELRDEHLTDESGFADVPADAWYAEPVATLAAMGAVKGYPQDGLFHPDDPITRAELVTIVTRLDERFDEGEWYGDLPFDDVSADHWALSVLSFAVNRGWLSGDTYDDGSLTGSFRPDDSITRAETMAVLNRMLGRLPETADDLLPGRIEWPDNRDEDAWYWIVVEEATNNHDHALKADGVHERWTRLLENVAE